MFSKNFIFTALFFTIILVCISCLEDKDENKYKELYTISPTDSSNFSVSLDGIEFIKIPNFNLDGKWKLAADTQKSKPLHLIFKGRKIYSALYSNYHFIKSIHNKENSNDDDYQTFAMYDKCPDENGVYDKKGNFLVIGSGSEKMICYKIISFEPTKLVLYDTDKGGELEFIKIGNGD